MNYSGIIGSDIANGEGVRVSLFVSGCTHHCKGCFNEATWDFAAGEPFTENTEALLFAELDHPWIDGLSLLGGEPMEPDNQRALVGFLEEAKRRFPSKTIWAYTGDLYEDLVNPASQRHTEVTDRLLACIDVLVDGPFVEAQRDISARFRGSSNQRILDLNATREAGHVVEWRGDEDFADRGVW